MDRIRTTLWWSLALALGSLVALAVGHLALVDIFRGGESVVQEWTALRVVFAILATSSLAAIVAALGALDRIG